MSRAPDVMAKAGGALARDQQLEDTTLGWRLINPRMQAMHGTDSMTQTAENLAREPGIDRDSQDAYALRSQQRAANAQRRGCLAEEITAVHAPRGGESVVARVDESNARSGGDGWTPILLELDDNFARSLAAMGRNDVLMVNPIRDGLNLVAMEGALVNDRDGGLVLSRYAGAWPALGEWADGVNPYDVSETASALSTALSRPAEPRRALAGARRRVAEGRTAHDWLDDQLAAAGD